MTNNRNVLNRNLLILVVSSFAGTAWGGYLIYHEYGRLEMKEFMILGIVLLVALSLTFFLYKSQLRRVTDNERIRAQAVDFRNSHFAIAPVWEFAIDEEGIGGQDETTLKPGHDLSVADASEGLLLVEYEFEAASGKRFVGFCSPSFDDSLSSIQPTGLVNNKMISFWLGISRPTEQTKKEVYQMLDEPPDTLFPVKFESTMKKPGGEKISGTIDGFMSKASSGDIPNIEK